MSGPEHYHEAERILDRIQRNVNSATDNTFDEVLRVAAVEATMALAHATLAQAAPGVGKVPT